MYREDIYQNHQDKQTQEGDSIKSTDVSMQT